MDNDLKITLQDEEGNLHDYFLIYTFDHPEKNRHYTIYTDYVPDEEDNISYYAMYHDDTDYEGVVYAVEDDDDWELVNTVLESFLEADDEAD